MKKIIVLFFAISFLLIGGCFKKGADKGKESGQTNDILTELIKEDMLNGSTNSNVNQLAMSNENLTEPIDSNAQPVAVANVKPPVLEKETPVEPELTTKAAQKSKEKQTPVKAEKSKPENIKVAKKSEKAINDNAIETPKASTHEAVAEGTRKGSFFKIGSDRIGQSVSPRKTVKMTIVVFSKSKSAEYADIKVYALPKGKGANPDNDYLISYVRNIDIVNGQAQLTKIWNGKNLDGDFLSQGKYNIYLSYTIKDSKMGVIKKEARYWGMSEQYYINLY